VLVSILHLGILSRRNSYVTQSYDRNSETFYWGYISVGTLKKQPQQVIMIT
jgi:hypothetical protein